MKLDQSEKKARSLVIFRFVEQNQSLTIDRLLQGFLLVEHILFCCLDCLAIQVLSSKSLISPNHLEF